MTNAIVPFNEMQQLAQSIATSKLFGIKTPEEALSLMAIAQAEGLHPAIAARDYHIIQGRPTLKADAMLARFQASGGKVEWHEYTDERCDATLSHPQGGTVRVMWDMARVTKAQITNSAMYKKYPRNMLRARVISEGIRTIYPGVCVGVYTPEEVDAFDDKTPRTQPVPLQSAQIIEHVSQPAKVDPPVHPETGEVSPHTILVSLTADSQEPDWVKWATTFKAAVISAQSSDELESWVKANAAAIGNLKDASDKLHGIVISVLTKMRTKFSDDNLDIPVFLQRNVPEAAE